MAPRLEVCAAESPELRGAVTFGGRPPRNFIHSLEALPVRVHGSFEAPRRWPDSRPSRRPATRSVT